MNEDKAVDEKKLESVSGGLTGTNADFEPLWAEYEKTYCVQCTAGPNGVSGGWTTEKCSRRKIAARSKWQLTGMVSCSNYHETYLGGRT